MNPKTAIFIRKDGTRFELPFDLVEYTIFKTDPDARPITFEIVKTGIYQEKIWPE